MHNIIHVVHLGMIKRKLLCHDEKFKEAEVQIQYNDSKLLKAYEYILNCNGVLNVNQERVAAVLQQSFAWPRNVAENQ